MDFGLWHEGNRSPSILCMIVSSSSSVASTKTRRQYNSSSQYECKIMMFLVNALCNLSVLNDEPEIEIKILILEDSISKIECLLDLFPA